MPRINEETVESVARLARLSLTPEERSRFARELEATLAWADSLQQLDTEGLPPLQPAAAGVLRDDAARPGLSRERALEAAPDAAEGLFRVPRVLP